MTKFYLFLQKALASGILVFHKRVTSALPGKDAQVFKDWIGMQRSSLETDSRGFLALGVQLQLRRNLPIVRLTLHALSLMTIKVNPWGYQLPIR